mgnify:CR=1 FL=1
MMDEFALIKQYFHTPFTHTLDVSGGLDDCAVLSLPEGYCQTISVDTMVEGKHFFADMAPVDIGYRALAVAVSDLAAMGAKPWWFTLALTLPEASEPWLKAFSEGLKILADKLDIQLIGGDTTRGPLAVSVQVAGLVPLDQGLYRSNAQVGDVVAVTGTLGDAAGGVAQWQQAKASTYLQQRYCRPTPRIKEAGMLLPLASSCIDISDGLLADAGHIAARSKLALRLELNKLPISDALRLAVGEDVSRQYATSGGDDYELCFTLARKHVAALRSAGLYFTVIGEVLSGAGVQLIDNDGTEITLSSTGYNHFND